MSGAAVDKDKTPTEEENKNPAWEDEEEKDQARKEVVTGLNFDPLSHLYLA